MLKKKTILFVEGLFFIFTLLMVTFVLSSLQDFAVRATEVGGIAYLRKELLLGFTCFFLLFIALLHYCLRGLLRPLEGIRSKLDKLLLDEQLPIFSTGEQEVYPELTHDFGLLAQRMHSLREEYFREQQKLQILLEEMDNDVAIIDEDGIILEVNERCRHSFGRTQELVGASQAKCFGNQELTRFIQQVLQTKQSGKVTLKLRVGESQRVYQTFVTPLTVAFRADPSRVLVVFHDITLLQAVYEKQAAFVSNASHELATPLTTIKGFAEALQEEDTVADAATRDRFIKIIVDESNRMHKLLQDLLQLARLDASEYRAAIELSAVTVQPILDSLQLELTEEAQKRSLSLDCLPVRRELQVQSNKNWLKQILLNLTENALKYTPQDGEIQLSCREEGKMAVFTVYNSGPGISEVEARRIFDRFYRIDQSHSRKKIAGTGLGLSIVKLLVEIMGGTITAQSKPGEGVSFVFTLPIIEQEKS